MRTERDSLGEVEIPDEALWGPQTQRAIENFPISGVRFGREFIHALGHVKRACAMANVDCGVLEARVGEAIAAACDEITGGDWDDQFPLDVFQTGSGTSTNMNANEVIATLARRRLAGEGVESAEIHPNDHVNRSQSSNDVIPTTIHVAATLGIERKLVPALERLADALNEKAHEFDDVIKTSRTHLMDAVPIRLGQEFGGYATQATKAAGRARAASEALRELPLGGTAAGTGMNRRAGFPELAIARLNEALGAAFVEAPDHVEAASCRDGLVEASGELRTIAVSLAKIAGDVRWLASGPRSGLGEIRLRALQPGSSIMPGKVNPVMSEALIMVASHVVAADSAVTLGGLGGRFELNAMMPLMGHHILTSINWMANAIDAFTSRCVVGIEVDGDLRGRGVEASLALATALSPRVGYDTAAAIAEEAYRSGRTVREVAAEMTELTQEELDSLLDARRMTEPDE